MVLVCNNPEAASQVLDSLPIEDNPVREQRLLAMKGRINTSTLAELQQQSYWQHLSEKFTEISHAD